MSVSRADQSDPLSLFDCRGQRKYLTGDEGRRFLAEAAKADPLTRALCRVLATSGCRISEALELSPSRLDRERGHIVFRTLKRRRLVFRAVPIPPAMMAELVDLAHRLGPDERIWPWCRQTGWRRIKRVMTTAGITGGQAMPKGLRHRFGVRAAEHDVPTALTQRWLGHASPRSTVIYQQAVGDEERSFAARLWDERTFDKPS
ncbi:tyrosine-type recombinase/integrase [Caulobacter mirabilis]|uniref:Integrase n=1 Tax=Caulobacter mirabilis TaxID=69666 RepID=A0A2D2AYQ8_9CAUL|nr:tyrosine-type recombinase/integrase [Caulobacter mirabilis]ATQ43133.1 integrase [Caulobacter mirabilis]